ncbi:hypothetical protein MJ524_29090 [Escherichia coli]|nr:hypothetical protein MJ524_29090 [Escherichia coli]
MWMMKSSLNRKQFVSLLIVKIQHYRSAHNDIRDRQRREKEADERETLNH